jgi:hypothetical protein
MFACAEAETVYSHEWAVACIIVKYSTVYIDCGDMLLSISSIRGVYGGRMYESAA